MFRRRALQTLFSVAAGAFALAAVKTAEASHFRYGNVSWRVPDPVNAPTTVEFKVTHGWRQSAGSQLNLSFGDGDSYADLGSFIGNGLDAGGNGYDMYEFTVVHTYATADHFKASVDGCCRISNLTVDNDGSFRVESDVDLSTGNTGSPVSQMPPIVALQLGGLRSLPIPAFDPDADSVTCRFSTGAENAISTGAPSIPGGAAPTLNGCTLEWDTSAGQVGQRFAISVALESTHGSQSSKSTIDFIVEFVPPPPPVCAGSGEFIIPTGQAFSTNLTGTAGVAGDMLAISATGMPAGATLSPAAGTSIASPATTTLSWTPTVNDVGTRIVLVMFRDTSNLTGFCPVTLTVPPCTGFGDPCSAGIGGCERQGQLVCLGSNAVCSAVAGDPSAETCNGVDDDCNGTVDEGFPVGDPCSVGVGACADTGLMACDDQGGVECTAVEGQPSAETCGDLVDADCDGLLSNGCGCGSDADCELCNEAQGLCSWYCESSADCASGQYCNDAGVCTNGCTSDSQCPGACEEGRCVACDESADCPAGLSCSQGACVALCASDADCSNGLLCDTEAGSCVACFQDSDCGQGSCREGQCVVGCQNDGDCAPGVCDETAGHCVTCTADADCGSGRCDVATQACVGCLADGDCAAPTTCDEATRTCVGCTADSQCGLNRVCDLASHVCEAECQADADCPEGWICDGSAGACVPAPENEGGSSGSGGSSGEGGSASQGGSPSQGGSSSQGGSPSQGGTDEGGACPDAAGGQDPGGLWLSGGPGCSASAGDDRNGLVGAGLLALAIAGVRRRRAMKRR